MQAMVDWKKIYVKRRRWAHKGEFGRLLVVGGSESLTGSPTFNAFAALRTGTDLVTVCAPRRAADVAAYFLPDVMSVPLDARFLKPSHEKTVLSLAEKSSAVCVGSGLGRRPETRRAVVDLVKKLRKPVVVDADGVRALAGKAFVLRGRQAVLTPHADEFRELTGRRVGEVLEERIQEAKAAAASFDCVVVLKGSVDVVTDGKRVFLNKTGSPLLTKGGFGDTLAGVCGAFLARGTASFEAACAAAELNGLAGELAAEKYGEAVLASDLFQCFAEVVARKSRKSCQH